MRETLKRLSQVKGGVCCTVILSTHKTSPENKKDPILLKNLIHTASKRLEKEYDSTIANVYTKKLNDLAAQIDHQYNDNGLILFVNESISEYLKLPTHPTSRVILDDTFATRSIIRALKKDTDYYVLVLTKGKARLIEANSDHLTAEVEKGEFPVTDNNLQAASRAESADAQRMTNLLHEFFNRIDKSVNKIRKNNPLPVVVYSEETNYSNYLKVADFPNTILGNIVLKNFDTKAANLVKEVWPAVKDLTVKKNRSRISELEQAIGKGNFLGDLNEIWTAVKNGRGKTIFVEEGYYQPVKNQNGLLSPISLEDIHHKEDINDIVDDMIEYTVQFGGDVVFLEKGSLKDFEKLALITRY